MGYRQDEAIIKAEAPSLNMDATEAVFFSRELEKIKSRTYDIKYPGLNGINGKVIPISTDAGPGAESITYRQYSQAGIAKIISNYADDLPRADVGGKEFTATVKSLGDAYGYSIQDIRAAAMANRPLRDMKAKAARRGNDIAANDIAWNGDAANNLVGLLTHPNIPTYTLPADGAGSATTFASKTTLQVLRDLNAPIAQMLSVTKGVEMPDTLALPHTIRQYLASTPMSVDNKSTILEMFMETNGYITEVVDCNELQGAGSGSTDVMFHFRKSSEVMTLEIPQPFEQFPVQRKNLEFIVPCHSRIGGVIVYYPLAIVKTEGI